MAAEITETEHVERSIGLERRAVEDSMRCPVCDSNELVRRADSRSYTPPYGSAREYLAAMITCSACGESFEDDGASDVAKEVADAADRESAKPMLEWLSDNRITMAYIERALGLPPRTLARWKSGDVSTGGIALLRIIRTFPWVLSVARARFDPAAAHQAVCEQAMKIWRSNEAANTSVQTSSGPSYVSDALLIEGKAAA